MPIRIRVLGLAAWVVPVLVALSGCSGPGAPTLGAPALGAPETFHWPDQPVTFRPPPGGWRREGDLSGGRRGVRFVKERSVGEAISVGEYYLLADRDRRAELEALATRVDTLDDRETRRELSRARWRTDDPFSESETRTAEAVNEGLDRAFQALLREDRSGVRREIESAEAAARMLRFTLDDVADRVVFEPAKRNEPARYRVIARTPASVAGHPALRVDFELRADEGLRRCCEVYVMHENHLFIAEYIGLERNLALFDRVIESITFPPRAEPGS